MVTQVPHPALSHVSVSGDVQRHWRLQVVGFWRSSWKSVQDYQHQQLQFRLRPCSYSDYSRKCRLSLSNRELCAELCVSGVHGRENRRTEVDTWTLSCLLVRLWLHLLTHLPEKFCVSQLIFQWDRHNWFLVRLLRVLMRLKIFIIKVFTFLLSQTPVTYDSFQTLHIIVLCQ